VELLVVLGVVGFFMLLLIPALARTQTNSSAGQCLNNHRQLMRACLMYAADSDDKFPGMTHGVGVVVNDPIRPWVQGWLDWTTSQANTNVFYLIDEQYASLAKYVGQSATVFKCPADRYLSTLQRVVGWPQRVRSVSGNVYCGSTAAQLMTGPFDPTYVVASKLSQFVNPGPAVNWVYLDEHPDSINDVAFWAPKSLQWIDLPASHHDNAGTVTFADGHAELHQWQSSVRNRPVVNIFPGLTVSSTDQDYWWLRTRTQRVPGAQ
jgi:prepilin-type processing-associated H-X9-DG protein